MIKQNSIVLCKSHPNRPVTYIYSRQKCPLPSRLACNKCRDDNKKEGFIDILEFLEDPFALLSLPNREQGTFDELYRYFQQILDPCSIFEQYENDMKNHIDQLKKDLEIQIQEAKKFQDMITQAKQQFLEATKHSQVVEKLKKITTFENYHQKQEWEELEQSLNEYVIQFIDQDNQELKQTLYSIQQKQKKYVQDQVFLDFNARTMQLCQNLTNQFIKIIDYYPLGIFQDSIFELMLCKEISPNQPIKASLLFKGTKDGMNAAQFWARCENQGPTLVICKSQNGTTFGGYSPCKWICNNKYQKDESKKSFLFNQNRKEFYPLFRQDYSIYGYQQKNHGPAFGGGHDLLIAQDFQEGDSILGHSYQVDNQNQIKNFNQKTHLMGSEKPRLVEIEVYLIEHK